MMPSLNELIGLPPTALPTEIAVAADRHRQTLFFNASCSDVNARRELITLHVAYLLWTYTGQEAPCPAKLQS